MKSKLLLFGLVLSVFSTVSAQAQTFNAKLWVVTPAQAENVTFPAPGVQEDVDFQTNGIAYIGQGTPSGPEFCVTIGSFLATCSTPAQPTHGTAGLTFTGFVNPNLGNQVAKTTTPINKTTYGELIDFTGTISLTSGQEIQILHDDGVELKIDGTLQPVCTSRAKPIASRTS